MINIEDKAKTTEQNAKYMLENLSKEIKTIYLTTSGIHIKRSIAFFLIFWNDLLLDKN